LSEDDYIRSEILEVLAHSYDQNPHKTIGKNVLLQELGLEENVLEGHILRLEAHHYVNVERDTGGWEVNLTPFGYEYYIELLEKIEPVNSDISFKENEGEILEIPQDTFQGIMKVFISHKFVTEDQKLALTLRKVLRGKNIEGYLAESKREYELLIGEKIRKEIENSDYVVGIITKESEKSASVNQELGYALGREIPIIMMVEKDVSHGVLTHGRETEEFTREQFEKHSINVVEYILEKGPRKKFAKNGEYDITLDKFKENDNFYIGVRNAKGKTIKSSTILCEKEICSWWDTHDPLPRHIYEGGGGNVLLPKGSEDANPTITVMSGNEVIEQMKLSDIVLRPNSQWDVKDENVKRMERRDMALNRIRSNLAALQNLYQTFLNYPKNVPINDEMKMSLSQKNELVENTQLTVNQASHVLAMDWMQSINDLCALAKKNPYSLRGRLDLLECEHCHGIISQIETLLKYLPNPPV